MKKLLKYLLYLLGIIVLVGICFALFIQIRGIPSYAIEKIDYKADVTPERVERGKKLALMLCSGCHADTETGKLTGKFMADTPEEYGKIYSSNITQDVQYGIGSWTDGELLTLFRTGIMKDGRYSPPYMAKMPNMADEDVASIIAFLHSDDPMVVATQVEDKPCEPSFFTKFLCFIAFEPLEMPVANIEQPDTADKVALGKYLAINLECYSCHSADYSTNNFQVPEKSEGYFGGGNKPLNMEGTVMPTSNLTPDKATGIGNWTEEQFIQAVKSGMKKGESSLRYPMMPYPLLTDYEAGAIFEYLKTIPPINNKVERAPFE